MDVLPDGAVTDFLAKGTDFLQTAQVAVINGTVEGLNPIKLAETALNDLDEIAGDLLAVIENLDDPLSAANEFMQLQQKWTGAGALTYMFTEKDPLTGLKKALTAMSGDPIAQVARMTCRYGSLFVKQGMSVLDSWHTIRPRAPGPCPMPLPA